jgi:hypothetical protein
MFAKIQLKFITFIFNSSLKGYVVSGLYSEMNPSVLRTSRIPSEYSAFQIVTLEVKDEFP